ncbi:unnamed protein product [Jaminaea pallidilutea]
MELGRSPAKKQRLDGAQSRSTDGALNTAPTRLVIALDLDAFYVAASRVRDASLVGLPIGIKQKGLLATCSYEARALGVDKLMTVKEALKRCPKLILVNGEDLSFFRRLSNEVWRLVRSIVWGAKVEKLGLDELFCDVTEMVDAHLRTLESKAEQRHGRIFFCTSQTVPNEGFEYDPEEPVPGHVLPSDVNRHHSARSHLQQRLIIASHLAAYMRQRIFSATQLTTSSGIAHNKLLAKLICSKHKPFDQTTFLPSGSDQVQNLLDPHDLRALMGFGSVVVTKLRAKLEGGQQSPKTDSFAAAPPTPFPVSLCRKAFSLDDLSELFGPRLGPRLWSLLHGRDDEKVVGAPLFPLQISIEDTYRHLRGGSAIAGQLRILSESLLRRLEAELVDDEVPVHQMKFQRVDEPLVLPAEEGKAEILEHRGVTVRCYHEIERAMASDTKQDADAGRRSVQLRSWKRYPLSVRLSIRQGWENRISRQTKMPLEIFDLHSRSRPERARALSTMLFAVFRSMARRGGEGESDADAINLLNIAAINLSTRRPAETDIGTLFSAAAEGGKGLSSPTKANRTRQVSGSTPAIDLATLAELPEEIRNEVAKQYGIDITAVQTKAVEERTTETDEGYRSHDREYDEQLLCQQCGVIQQPWLQHDHLRWPIAGVPPCFATSSRNTGQASGSKGVTSLSNTWTRTGQDDDDWDVVDRKEKGEGEQKTVLSSSQADH